MALCATSAELVVGLRDPSGWKEIDRRAVDGVGEIVIRHKEVLDNPCLEGTTTAALPPDLLLDAATDVANQPRWSSWDVAEAVKLSAGPTEFDYYQVLDNPAPVADRYWFLRARVSRAGDDRVFTWELVEPEARYPEALASVQAKFPGAVMTRANVGDWTFSPGAAGTRIRYRICTDAGGKLPQWVGKLAATRTLPTNIADIVREVKRRVGS
jgi:hypothetical protein